MPTTKTANFVKIGDIEISSFESLDVVIEKAMDIYAWKMEVKKAKKSGEEIDLEQIFEETPKKKKPSAKKEFFSI